MSIDFHAYQDLSNKEIAEVRAAIKKADDKADMARFKVCITTAGNILVLPEFSAKVRDDIAKVVYDTDAKYNVSAQ